ncbi:dihydrolipoyllysine-residue acetyltransferase [Psychrosphaera aquimarina]|uniref:Dihydrolipoamide acetyltransferase component of pyruvate dehydrogenase complex n=1 Tax=Psychrosphaera aquimarina TaxID=2044854 RepID=A0ABU3QWB5_9GAMM|nr:dihydrolipoyllysine-residue acetyltransferase [Psychrosphaera aquimarina]MDU0111724.1 dihydrolipoyllysine-residue acetyltransferase [Psychrosphaera aquimarina]
MSKDFILPDIGEGIVECEVVEWLVAEGDTIVEDQPVCDVMTDKALVQIPAMSDGVVTKLYYQKGEIAQVHQPLFAVSSAQESAQEVSPAQGVVEQIMDHAPVKPTNLTVNEVVEDFLLPDIGEGIVECEVVDWLVAEGDEVKEDQAICDVMTDKALVQIPAKSDGIIEKLYYEKGEIAKVHQPLFAIAIKGSTAVAEPNVVANVSQSKATTAVLDKESSNVVAISTTASSAKVNNSGQLVTQKAVASPAVRRLAREMNLDIRTVNGSGAKGRVYKEDLVAHTQQAQTPYVAASVIQQQPQAELTQNTSDSSYVEPIKGIKAVMAKAMQTSVSTIPHFTFSDEIDLTEIVKLRKQLKPEYEKQGIKLTMMPFFMKAMSLAIKQFPVMNSQPNDDCTELTYFNDHNIGMAVDSKVGLLVPNIKSCQNKSIKEIAIAVMEMTELAREGRLSPDKLKGGTISISNIGALGGTTATPIINKPEVAIVALGKMQTLPRFNDKGEVEARQLMNVSWSGDHRVIDGGTIARFNNLWTQYLQNPSSMIMDMI